MKNDKTRKHKGVSKEQWFTKALDVLENRGFEAVKVEQLAKQLGTSRSGFYFHFRNRQDLLQRLLEYWAREYTAVITENLDMTKLDADKRLFLTMDMVKKKRLPKYDLAMNAWAKVDPLVDKVVKKVIQMRLDFTRTIFKELGFDGDELEMRARMFLCYHAWEEVMFTDDHDDEYVKLQKLRYKMFIK